MSDGTNDVRMDQIILALLEHPTTEMAAAALNMSAVTLWRWQQKPEFQEAFRKARRQAFSRAVARLQHYADAAGAAILKIMSDMKVHPAVRLRAANSVLEHATTAFRLEDLEVRLQRLEQGQFPRPVIDIGDDDEPEQCED